MHRQSTTAHTPLRPGFVAPESALKRAFALLLALCLGGLLALPATPVAAATQHKAKTASKPAGKHSTKASNKASGKHSAKPAGKHAAKNSSKKSGKNAHSAPANTARTVAATSAVAAAAGSSAAMAATSSTALSSTSSTTSPANSAEPALTSLVATQPVAPATLSAPTLSNLPANGADCPLQWTVTAQLATEPRHLLVDLVFDAGTRTRTTLRLPGGWAGLLPLGVDTPQAVPDAPALRSVAHAAGQRVTLHWRITPSANPAQSSSAQLTPQWFALAGQGVLPMPDELDERSPPTACVRFAGLPEGSRWVSSHGAAEGASAQFQISPGAAPLRTRVQQSLYAGGALSWQQLSTDGQPVLVATPANAPWRFDINNLGAASAQAVAAQRRLWADTAPGKPLLVLLLPGQQAAGATTWQQALALQAPMDLAVPSVGYDTLITNALLPLWLADRFGPLAQQGRGDEALRAWFSEGWAVYYGHRLLLREGRWTPDDYASTLNRQIERYLASPERGATNQRVAQGLASSEALAALPAARGEFLALQWQAALRATGHPGLDAVMQRLLVPPALARREGPISAPLATQRLVASLRHVLGDAPMRDITLHIDQGTVFDFGPNTLGPCFVGQRVMVPSWRLGFDAESLNTRVLRGVDPTGPAFAAGLRDGMVVLGHAMVPGDSQQPVRLQVREAGAGAGEASANAGSGTRELSYLPAGEPLRELPRYQPVPKALQQNACLGWLGLGPDAGAAEPASRRAALAEAARPGKTGARASAKSKHKSAGRATGRHGGKAGAKITGKKAGKAAASLSKKAKRR